jgi:hypothetical protein
VREVFGKSHDDYALRTAPRVTAPAADHRRLCTPMKEDFYLIDLVSQAAAVQRLLCGKSAEEKLAWLASRGKITKMEKKMPQWPDTYYFTSSTGAECAFILDGDAFCFAGDHTFFTVPTDEN